VDLPSKFLVDFDIVRSVTIADDRRVMFVRRLEPLQERRA
jgi:hypothetical protein